jgi:V/A-type H+-transporting ATPase subunit E
MEHNIDQLTEKIYQEGIEKGKQEGKQIVEQAKSQAAEILKKAEQDADKIKVKAQQEAENLKNNTLSEIKLAGDQSISALKQKIKDLISENILDKKIRDLFVNEEFLKTIILEIIKDWDVSQGMNVTLSKNVEAKLSETFEASVIKAAKGLIINFDNRLKGGFKINESGSSYQLAFSDEDFIEFFKPFLRKKAEEILFN